MKTFEFDVEVRVRKTLIVSLPRETTIANARSIMNSTINGGSFPLSTFQKWNPATGHQNVQPVETVLDKKIEIVSVRDVTP